MSEVKTLCGIGVGVSRVYGWSGVLLSCAPCPPGLDWSSVELHNCSGSCMTGKSTYWWNIGYVSQRMNMLSKSSIHLLFFKMMNMKIQSNGLDLKIIQWISLVVCTVLFILYSNSFWTRILASQWKQGKNNFMWSKQNFEFLSCFFLERKSGEKCIIKPVGLTHDSWMSAGILATFQRPSRCVS